MKMKRWIFIGLLSVAVGCSETSSPDATSEETSTTPQSSYVTTSEPANALPVGEARGSVEDDQKVTVEGTIGGSSEPFVDGMAAFTIVDTRVPYCAAEEGCPTPWDYCCTQDRVKDNIATVKVVDQSGRPVADDAKTLLGVKELSTVVVTGTARRDEQGNLTVEASQVFVKTGA